MVKSIPVYGLAPASRRYRGVLRILETVFFSVRRHGLSEEALRPTNRGTFHGDAARPLEGQHATHT